MHVWCFLLQMLLLLITKGTPQCSRHNFCLCALLEKTLPRDVSSVLCSSSKRLLTQQQPPSPSVRLIGLQIGCDALGRNTGYPLQPLQRWGYEEEKLSDQCQFFSFCLARPAGNCTPIVQFDSKQTSEILPTIAHIHMKALTCEARLLTLTTFCSSTVASLFHKNDKLKCQVHVQMLHLPYCVTSCSVSK